MLDISALLRAQLEERLRSNYAEMFDVGAAETLEFALAAATTALGHIATSNALYHNVEHTVYVTIVGSEILNGRQAVAHDVNEKDWLNVIIALLCHDIGYVRGICAGDRPERLVTGLENQTSWVSTGVSDAALMPIHVDRGKQFVYESFADVASVNVADVQACIERTRFPVPGENWYQQNDDYPGLVRAADLIGQLSDPRYLYKLTAVFYEFEEIGFNDNTGYQKPGDLLEAYPSFFAHNVAPYIDPACAFLQHSETGREVVTNLQRNLEDSQRADVFLPAANLA